MVNKISETDVRHLSKIRENVASFIKKSADKYDKEGTLLLDIAPQDHEGASPYFKNAKYCTLDIDPDSGADFIADICNTNIDIIENDYFDFVVCTEVLEHTLNPFLAVNEIYRILKPNGLLFLSVPFNFRIHGPLPDCWRFTEHGLRAMLNSFSVVEITPLETEERWLMPIQYTVTAKKKITAFNYG
jgi:SAM-dependent methyltransferase